MPAKRTIQHWIAQEKARLTSAGVRQIPGNEASVRRWNSYAEGVRSGKSPWLTDQKPQQHAQDSGPETAIIGIM
jgi:hypothetical protein